MIRKITHSIITSQAWRRALLSAAGLCALSLPLHAQSSADPGHLDERFQPRPAQPSVGAPVTVPTTPHPTLPADTASVSFAVTSVGFEGNTVLPGSVLQALAAHYIGPNITLAQAYELAGRVTAAYRDAGYILTRAIVPAQKVTNGHLRIQIVQGYVDKSAVQGDAGGARSYLDAYGHKITSERPLTSRSLERELLLASDISGMNVRSVLTASQTAQGAADLTLVVAPKKVEGFLQVDNRGSRYLGPYEVMGGVFVNDAFNLGGRLGLNAVVTPDSGPDLGYGGISLDQPLGSNGLRLFTDFNYAVTKPGDVLRDFDTEGRSLNTSTSLSYPFIRSRNFNLMGSATFAYHDVHSENAVIKPLFDDHVRSFSAQMFMNVLDDWGGYSTASLSVTRGVPIFGATKFDDPNKSRTGASGEFTRANFSASHEQPITNRLSLLLATGGQTSFGAPLLASEQFSLGGDSFDRAFDPSEVTGDSAIAGRGEARFDILSQPMSFLSSLQLYGFVEGGKVWQSDVLPGTLGSQDLVSSGAGLRFAISARVNADLQWAKPLNRNVLGANNQNSRFFFAIGTNF